MLVFNVVESKIIVKWLRSWYLNMDIGSLHLDTFLQLMHFLSITASCGSMIFLTYYCLSIFQFPLVIICLSSVMVSQFSSNIFLTRPYCFS